MHSKTKYHPFSLSESCELGAVAERPRERAGCDDNSVGEPALRCGNTVRGWRRVESGGYAAHTRLWTGVAHAHDLTGY
jgi:hypothetical protein